MKTISMDVGGTFIKWAILDEKLNIIEKGKFKSEALIVKTKGIIFKAASKANALIKVYPDICCAGLAFPGIINSSTSQILSKANNLPESEGVNIASEFNKICNLKVMIINDANAAALGELAVGKLKGKKSGVLITFGTGIGAGVIINGKIYQGNMFTAGEVGRQLIDGRRWEELCSVRTLVTRASLILDKPDITGEEVFELSKTEPIIEEMLTKWLKDIAKGLSNIIYTLNPEKIVLGGGVSENKLFNIDTIINHTKLLVDEKIMIHTEISKSSTGNDAGLYGIAQYLIDNL